MSTEQTETRTLEDVSFETFQMAKIALERHADRAGDEVEQERATEALAELVDRWNAANTEVRDDE